MNTIKLLLLSGLFLSVQILSGQVSQEKTQDEPVYYEANWEYKAVDYKRTEEGLTIMLPENLPNNVALAFKIQVDGILEKRSNTGSNSVIPDQT